jgi:hypothetical protein
MPSLDRAKTEDNPVTKRAKNDKSNVLPANVDDFRVAVRTLPSWPPTTICCTIWTCQHHFVTIKVTEPNLPVVRASISIGRIPVTWHYHFDSHRLGSCDCGVYVINFKPQQQSITRRQVGWVADRSVMMRLFPPMQLQNQFP